MRTSGLEGHAVSSYGPRNRQNICSLTFSAALSSGSSTRVPSHLLQIASRQSRIYFLVSLFFSSHEVAPIDPVISDLASSDDPHDGRAPFPAVVSRWMELKRHQHFKHMTPLNCSSTMIRLMSRNFSVLGEREYFGIAIASTQLRRLHIAIQRGDFSWL